MRIALAHDYLTQRGGAERVALMMAQTFPGAPLYTSTYQPMQTFPEFRAIDIRASSLQRVPVARNDPRLVFPALPWAWSRTVAEDADVVLASSSGWAHAVGVPQGCRKIIYCHNTPRWLYQTREYLPGTVSRGLFATVRRPLIAWDRAAAMSADVYIANSAVVAERVRRAYGIEAEVLHPPVVVDPTAPQRPVEGLEPGYWLTIARGRGYKNTQALIDGVRLLRGHRLVVVGAAGRSVTDPHVTFLGAVPEERLRWLYTHARALVSVSQEDFGLTPVEANAFGTPVAVLRAGGFLETTSACSGVFIEEASPPAVRDALATFPDFDPDRVRENAERFSVGRFAARLKELVQSPG